MVADDSSCLPPEDIDDTDLAEEISVYYVEFVDKIFITEQN